jgi:serine phosphatase RsbU (regulator of sigma subunit)
MAAMDKDTNPRTARPADDGGSPVRLRCMEIWGGNTAHDNAISVPGIDAYVHSRPHQDSSHGGDIHYVSMCGSGRISRFVVADVSGHGTAAGEVADQLRALMRRYINTPNQARFARTLNTHFSRLATDGMFATAVLATYFAPTDHLILVNAGHPAPLWYRADRESWHLLTPAMANRAERVANLPLGVIAPTDYEQFAVRLAPRDTVIIYTDSLVEARSPDGRMLGEQGLLQLACGLEAGDPDRLRCELLRAVAAYAGRAESDDDLTLLMLHHNAADPPFPALGDVARSIGKLLGLIRY